MQKQSLRRLSMPQKLDKLNTGIKGLDDDLRELFAICEDKKKLDTIKQVIANKDISSEEFSKVIPEVLITLSLYLSGPQLILLLDNINEGAVGLVREAKSLIDENFGNLFENETAKSILKSKATEEEGEDAESITGDTIQGIQHYFLWEDEPPKLLPAVRMGFKNRKGKILLSTRLDWDDFSFLLRSLSRIFVELLEKGKPLAELGQINLSYSEKVSKNMEEALGNLQKTKEIMPIYKAKTKTAKKKRSVKDSTSQN